MSTVIKAGQSFKLVNCPTTIDLADHLAEARQVVAQARAQAREIGAKARRDAAAALHAAEEKGRSAGVAEGTRAGLEAGREQALAEARQRFTDQLATLRDAFNEAVVQFNDRKRDLLIEARHDVMEFTVSLARRVAKRIGELDRSAAAANLQEALDLVSVKTDLTVCVNPVDGKSMRRFAEDLTKNIKGLDHVRILEDPSVGPGGCTVEAGETEIDAGIETQMDEIVRLLAL